jgi:hypothetical protein
MSLQSEISTAASEAQGFLAQLGGMPVDGTNSLYNAQTYVAVYGSPQVQNQMLPQGGYRQRTFLSATVTRAQFDVIPLAKTKWTRTDLDPQQTYTIDSVGQHDANLLTLTLIRPGE